MFGQREKYLSAMLIVLGVLIAGACTPATNPIADMQSMATAVMESEMNSPAPTRAAPTEAAPMRETAPTESWALPKNTIVAPEPQFEVALAGPCLPDELGIDDLPNPEQLVWAPQEGNLLGLSGLTSTPFGF